MYTTAFIIGFFTSWGWWSAGKLQRQVDNMPFTVVEKQVEVNQKKEIDNERTKETPEQK